MQLFPIAPSSQIKNIAPSMGAAIICF